MKPLLVSVFLLAVCSARAENWKGALRAPSQVITPSVQGVLTTTAEQVSCEHLEFRYTQIKHLLQQLDWLLTDMSTHPAHKDIYNYIRSRSSLDIRALASQQQFVISYKIAPPESSEAIGILKATDFEQLTEVYPTANYSELTKNEDGSLTFKTKVNAFDICEKKSIDVLFLAGCPQEVVSELPCVETGVCTDSYVADWQACTDVKAIRVKLNSLQSLVGKRTKTIKKVW